MPCVVLNEKEDNGKGGSKMKKVESKRNMNGKYQRVGIFEESS